MGFLEFLLNTDMTSGNPGPPTGGDCLRGTELSCLRSLIVQVKVSVASQRSFAVLFLFASHPSSTFSPITACSFVTPFIYGHLRVRTLRRPLC